MHPPNSPTPSAINPETAQTFYRAFEDHTFVTKLSGKPLDNTKTLDGILGTIHTFLDHRIHNVFVHGGGKQIDALLGNASKHPKTHLRITPKSMVPAIVETCLSIQRQISERCQALDIPHMLLDPGVIRAEKIPGHCETGRVVSVDIETIRRVIERRLLAIIPFGGRDENGSFLNVNADTSAAMIAAALHAEKLFFMTNERGVLIPNGNGEKRILSYVDFDGLIELLRRQHKGTHDFVIDQGMLPKISAAALAVTGGANSVHILEASGEALEREALTHLGDGTVIERIQTHRIVPAHDADLDALQRIRAECSTINHQTPRGTPYLKPLPQDELRKLIPTSLVFRHREEPIGTIYFQPVLEHPGTAVIGGFAVSERHQNTQHGGQLFETCLETLREAGYVQAVSITASPNVKALYGRFGKRDDGSFSGMLEASRQRFAPEEQDSVELFVFDLRQQQESDAQTTERD